MTIHQQEPLHYVLTRAAAELARTREGGTEALRKLWYARLPKRPTDKALMNGLALLAMLPKRKRQPRRYTAAEEAEYQLYRAVLN